MDVLDKFFIKYAYKFPKGYPDLKDKQDILLMESILKNEFDIVLEEEQSLQDYPEYYGKLTDEQRELLANNPDYKKDITFSSGGKYTPIKLNKNDNYTVSDLEQILKDFEEPVYLTYATTAIKLRTPFGIRIMGFDPSNIKLNNDNFHRIKALDQFIKDNPDKIKIKGKLPAGLGYEAAQVDNLSNAVNDILKIFPKQKDIELWIDMEPQGVKVDGAIKRKDVGKADIALTNNGKEVYWISYKEGAYKDEEGAVKSNIPFQQYGSLKTLYSTEFDKEMTGFGNYFKGLVKDFLDTIKESKQSLVFRDIETVDYENKEIINKNGTKTDYSTIITWAGDATGLKSKELKSSINKGVIDIVFIDEGENYYNAFVEDNNKNSLLLAGKAVYGVDFDFNNKDYSSENCNVLLQSDGTVELNIITGEDEESIEGLNIEMEGGTGNVIYHPDLPTRPDEPLYGYTPALNLRHTKSQVFIYKSGDGNITAIIGGRFLIYPVGGISSKSTKINL